MKETTSVLDQLERVIDRMMLPPGLSVHLIPPAENFATGGREFGMKLVLECTPTPESLERAVRKAEVYGYTFKVEMLVAIPFGIFMHDATDDRMLAEFVASNASRMWGHEFDEWTRLDGVPLRDPHHRVWPQ